MVLALMPCVLIAETPFDRDRHRHELRLGWGDQMFETLMWRTPGAFTATMPAAWTNVYHEDYHYHQHLWLEYQYRPNRWLGFGGMIDLSEVDWTDVTRNGQGTELSRDPGHYFYNVVIMPTVRFTYFQHEYVNLYSGLGLGMGINGGSEKDAKGRKDVVGAAVNLTFFGVSANYKQWFAAVEIGAMISLQNANAIFMAGSRIFAVSTGVRF